jgi:signal transduction histidine kinase
VTKSQDARLDQVLEGLLALARLDFGHRIAIGDGGDVVDAIAIGINMVGEELEETAASRRELEAAYHALEASQAQLIHAGKLAAIGQLAGGVAHEINNPASYVGLSHAVLGKKLAQLGAALTRAGAGGAERPEIAETLAVMQSALRDASEGMDRIRAVVRDLRTFSRMDDEAMEAVALNDVVLAACNLARHEIRYRAELVTSLGEVPPVRGNRGRLGQVMMNLLVNAAQALPETSEGTQRIEIATRRDGERAVLTVEDSGTGVPEHLRQRIFEPFFTTKPPDLGTGLGLSLVLEIVRRHHGSIDVGEGREGGARFEVRLPLFGTGEAMRAAGVPAGGSQAAARARILMVDDDQVLLRSVRALLEPEHDVVTARGGAEAIAIIDRDQRFDLVICDLLMPRIDGVAVFAALERRAPQLLPRVVFSSGGAVTRRSKDFLAQLPNRVLEKPIERGALLDVIAEFGPARDAGCIQRWEARKKS